MTCHTVLIDTSYLITPFRGYVQLYNPHGIKYLRYQFVLATGKGFTVRCLMSYLVCLLSGVDSFMCDNFNLTEIF